MLVGCCCALVLMATAASTVVQVREIAFTAMVQCSCAPPSLTPRRIHHKGCLPILRLQRFPLWSPQWHTTETTKSPGGPAGCSSCSSWLVVGRWPPRRPSYPASAESPLTTLSVVESLARIAGKDCRGKGFEQEVLAAISRDLQLHTCSHWWRARYLVHTLVLGWHRTQRGDSSIGLQRCEQLGAGFSCGAGAFDKSDTRAECA